MIILEKISRFTWTKQIRPQIKKIGLWTVEGPGLLSKKLVKGKTYDLIVNGQNFDNDTFACVVPANSNYLEVEEKEIAILNSNELTFNFVAETIGLYDVVIFNGNLDPFVISEAIEVYDLSSSVVDLRLGGTEFPDSAIQMRDGMSFTRSNTGMHFSGASPWSSWVRFVGEDNRWTWKREETSMKLSVIFTNTTYFMIGLGSSATSENNTIQYSQAETLAYCNSASNFYGFYGNNGTLGTLARVVASTALLTGSVRKVTFENNAEPGSNYYVYDLASSDTKDWVDNETLKRSAQMPSEMSADESILMPFCCPHANTNTQVLGFIIEEM